jgi:hypothetical protein
VLRTAHIDSSAYANLSRKLFLKARWEKSSSAMAILAGNAALKAQLQHAAWTNGQERKHLKTALKARHMIFRQRGERRFSYFASPRAAWAAARRAIGTRNGEQLT